MDVSCLIVVHSHETTSRSRTERSDFRHHLIVLRLCSQPGEKERTDSGCVQYGEARRWGTLSYTEVRRPRSHRRDCQLESHSHPVVAHKGPETGSRELPFVEIVGPSCRTGERSGVVSGEKSAALEDERSRHLAEAVTGNPTCTLPFGSRTAIY